VPRPADEADLDVQPVGAQQPGEHDAEVREASNHDHSARACEGVDVGGCADVVHGQTRQGARYPPSTEAQHDDICAQLSSSQTARDQVG
jgi:hypothetical protein